MQVRTLNTTPACGAHIVSGRCVLMGGTQHLPYCAGHAHSTRAGRFRVMHAHSTRAAAHARAARTPGRCVLMGGTQHLPYCAPSNCGRLCTLLTDACFYDAVLPGA